MNKPELDKIVMTYEKKNRCIHNKPGNIVPYCIMHIPRSSKCAGCDYDLKQREKMNLK